MKILRVCSIIFLVVFSFVLLSYSNIVYFKKFAFDEERPLIHWNKMILNGEVKYLPVKSGGESFIKASSRKACSALYYRIKFKLDKYPLLSWKWRVLKYPEVSALDEKEKDDYAARLYVVFPSLSFSSSKFIEYVWAKDLPVGTIIKKPSANNVRLIVARNSKIDNNEWVGESRNTYADYVSAFGEKPRMSAGAVAIMCDSDNSKTEAEAIFDDIAIGSQEGISPRL